MPLHETLKMDKRIKRMLETGERVAARLGLPLTAFNPGYRFGRFTQVPESVVDALDSLILENEELKKKLHE